MLIFRIYARKPNAAASKKSEQAYAVVHDERPELWGELFHVDDFHPSGLGTYLMACVVYSGLGLARAWDSGPALNRRSMHTKPNGKKKIGKFPGKCHHAVCVFSLPFFLFFLGGVLLGYYGTECCY